MEEDMTNGNKRSRYNMTMDEEVHNKTRQRGSRYNITLDEEEEVHNKTRQKGSRYNITLDEEEVHNKTRQKGSRYNMTLDEEEVHNKTRQKGSRYNMTLDEDEVHNKTRQKVSRYNITIEDEKIKTKAVKQDELKEKLTSLIITHTEEKLWFETRNTCDSPPLIQTKLSEKDPSLLCQQQNTIEELCFCIGGQKSKKYKMFCGFCEAAFIPNSAKKTTGPDMKAANTSTILKNIIKKAKQRIENLNKEWSFLDANEGMQTTHNSPFKTIISIDCWKAGRRMEHIPRLKV